MTEDIATDADELNIESKGYKYYEPMLQGAADCPSLYRSLQTHLYFSANLSMYRYQFERQEYCFAVWSNPEMTYNACYEGVYDYV